MLPCKYFTTSAGCGRGKLCQYSHDTDSTATTPLSIHKLDLDNDNQRPTQLLRPKAQALIACKFFAKGKCQKGDACLFSHEVIVSTSSKVPPPNQICRFFVKGRCTKGDRCNFQHKLSESNSHSTMQSGAQVEATNTSQSISPTDTTPIPLAVAPAVTKNYDDTPPGMLTRAYSGGLAIFGDGGKVHKLSVASDFTTIRITGLPQHTNIEFIETMLDTVDLKLPGVSIRITRMGNPLSVSAYLRIELPMIGPILSKELESAWIGVELYAQLKATPIPTHLFTVSDASRGVDCRKVVCSWYRPSKLAFLKYKNKHIATIVCNNFNNGHYTVDGKVLTCDKPIISDRPHDRDQNFFVCVLKNIPISADKEMIAGIFHERHRPNELVVCRNTFEASEKEAHDYVKRLFSTIGPLESWDPIQDQKSRRNKVRVRFHDDSDAREAISQLNDKNVEILGKGKLMIQQIISAKFKVTKKVYLVLQSQIEAEKKIWVEQRIYVGVYQSTDVAQRFTSLKIEGELGENFTTAKAKLEKLLNGAVAMAGGKPIWNEYFMQPIGLAKLKQVERDFDVGVNRDRTYRKLRLYGSPRNIECAQYKLHIMIKSGLEGYAIVLNREDYLWVSSGGFQQIVSALGKDVASVDILSNPKKLLLAGDPKNYHRAMEILKAKSVGSGSIKKEVGEDCSICWSPAEFPIRTKCGHLYCLQCFENLCSFDANGDKEVSITCEASECNVVISLKEIQQHLPSTSFEEILVGSFKSYVRRHPGEFLYCPTPDCKEIYRATHPIKSRTCASCLTETCISCHISHTGQTCADYRYQTSGGDEVFKRLMSENGYKSCPACETIIEKMSGCNHMICPGCKIHICWLCLETFSVESQCYDHLNHNHGNIGLLEDHENEFGDLVNEMILRLREQLERIN